MAKAPELIDVNNLANAVSAITQLALNNANIEDAFNNTISRDGSTPNNMEADFDMNSYRLLNVADPVADTDGVNKRTVGALVSEFADKIVETAVFGTQRVETFLAVAGQTSKVLQDSPGSVENLEVFVDGIALIPGQDFVLTGDGLKTVQFAAPLTLNQEVLVRYSKSLPSGTSEAGAVSFTQAGVGMLTRTVESKLRETVSADDRGMLGTGVDETLALQSLLDASAGKTLLLGRGKTYGYNPTIGLTIPANTNIISNGAKFKRTAAQVGTVTDSSYNFVVGDNTKIDSLEVDCVGGFNDISGVRIAGSNVRIGLLKINTPSRAAAQGGAWVGAKIGPDTGTATNVVIDRIESDLWDRAFTVQNITGGSIGYVDIQRYKRGLYLNNCKDFNVYGGHIRTGSVGNTGKAGENGVLIESRGGDFSTERVRIMNVTVENAGEHGFRIGADTNRVRDIWHVNCLSRRHGSGYGTETGPNDDDHGGCGFKALGPTLVSGKRLENIFYINCVAEDGVIDSAVDRPNFAGFQIGKCYNAQLVNPTVRPAPSGTYADPATYSSLRGIEIIGCENVVISNPNIIAPKVAGIHVYDGDTAGGTYDWGISNNIKVTGGQVMSYASLPMDAGVEVRLAFGTNLRRFTIDGLLCDGGANAVKCTLSGGSLVTTPSCDVTVWNQTTETFAGCGSWTIRARGAFIGTNACVNGSIWQSFTAGAFRVMKAGAWTSL